ncbi:hypothetical protein M408DRAFT_325872 [Serendipita vermifera MAFF 305830]|uniref:RNA helicase n=1 Tax=Serendipita vermifera MAFF 305830 TaxID=933852 RepID=A0A0C3BSW1_SERVB|nr:hypothetical protein M408DRAFT_325872 [Serendipita vermifera MAFF 305830]
MAKNQEYLDAHLKGLKHAAMQKARESQNVPKKCTICNVRLMGTATENAHINGQQHRARLAELRGQGRALNERNLLVDDDENMFECSVCEVQVYNQTRRRHEQTHRHKRKERFLSIRATLEEAEKDKNGVMVHPSDKKAYDLGMNEAGLATLDFSLKVEHPRSRIVLRTATLANATRNRSCFSVNISTNVYLSSRTPLKGTVVFDSEGNRGRFQDRLELVLYDVPTQKQFAIVKPLSIIVGSRNDYEDLKPVAPYIPKKKIQREPVKEVVEGERPPAISAVKWVMKLPSYDYPKALKTILDMPTMKEKIRLLRSGFVPRELISASHARWFHVMLYIEEHQSTVDIERYDQEESLLDPIRGGLYSLKVPGLAEKRPSLIVGDKILVKEHGGKPRWWSGYVHRVELETVGLRFNPGFKPIKNQKFDVRFTLNRLTLQRMHLGLDTGGLAPRLLFPSEADVKNRKPSEGTIKTLNPINRLVGQNPPQMLAVTAIRNLLPGSPPFVVFGPPGTGKTVTVIEAIRQILVADPQARILACAPSNSAADIIAERLTVLGKSQLFRLYAPSRSASLLPPALQQFSRRNDHGTFEVPPVEELAKFRVVVSTCLSAVVPSAIGISPGHFSHVFIDEAGQACEPEALIAIRTLATAKTNLILSGDPKQLGPIIRSDVALSFKFGVGLLDRLTEMPLYDDQKKNGITIVKLIQNFRSHPAILRFPNERFYHGDLQAKADPTVTHAMERASCVVKPGFPVIFHSIVGKDLREASSPSFFNVEEASLVKKYVQDLKSDQRLRLSDEHIGVISPYNAQCGKIRKALQAVGKGIKVGSVEEFQGQERRVIIVSTVRSNVEFVLSDITHTLGFIANPRRFNVAMTRAQALLIVIGDPNVLSLDPLWRSFLNYIYNNGGWTGRPSPSWNTNDPDVDGAELLRARRAEISAEEEELITKVTETIDRRVRTEDMDDFGDGYEVVERPWRETE